MVFDHIFKVIFRYLENSYAYLDKDEDGREKGRKQDALLCPLLMKHSLVLHYPLSVSAYANFTLFRVLIEGFVFLLQEN